MIKFYNRKKELEILEKHFSQIKHGSILDVIVGRRRIGKTELVKEFIKNKRAFYFFVSRKSITGLLEEWSEILRIEFPEIGEFNSLEKFLISLFEIGKKQKLILVFDEFQNFKYIDPTAFSVFQKIFDEYKNKSEVLLIVIGSLITLMEKIFIDSKEPLFGRATRIIYLEPLNLPTISKWLNNLGFKTKKEVLDLYSIFNGIPKYYRLIEEENLGGQSLEKIVKELILSQKAILQKEGEILLQQEFGKEYQRYFTILSLISQGKTKLSEIANSIKLPTNTVNAYLDKLEKKFRLIEKRLPILEKPPARLSRYYLKDTFLIFWFRFVYRYLSWIEKGAENLLWQRIKRDFLTYQGQIFEEISRNLLFQKFLKGDFYFPITKIGRFWDKKGEVEIDIVALSEDKKAIFLGECKLNPKQINKTFISNFLNKSSHCSFRKFKKKYLAIISFGKLNSYQKSFLKKAKIDFINLENLI